MTLTRRLSLLIGAIALWTSLALIAESRPKDSFMASSSSSSDKLGSISKLLPIKRQNRNSENPNGSSSSSRNSRAPYLRMKEAPPAELITTVNANEFLECEAGGHPAPTIHWLKDGQRIAQGIQDLLSIDDGSENPGTLGLSLTKSRLYLDCIQPQDTGVYTCVAENAYHRQSAETRLKVTPPSDIFAAENSDNSLSTCLSHKKTYGSPARIHLWTHNRLEFIGSDARIFCRSSGTPIPTVTWFGPEDNLLAGDKYRIMKNGDLVIKDLSWNDMGSYTCAVQNEYGADRTSTFVYPALPDK